MSNIDTDQLVTAEAKLAKQDDKRRVLVAAETTDRIEAVANAYARENMAAAAAAGLLSEKDLETYRSAVRWIDQMRASFRTLVADPTLAPTDDAHWPEVHPDVIALANRY